MLTILSWIPRIARFVQIFQGVAGTMGSFMPWIGTVIQRFRGGTRTAHLSMARG